VERVPSARSICLVQSELLGNRAAGGIASAHTHLAQLLARAGHRVTLLDCSAPAESISHEWRTTYGREGITLERLRRERPFTPTFAADSAHAYHQLRDRPFDLIVFQDWLGLGQMSMAAKRCGLAFGGTRLVHIVHGPTQWLWEANRQLELSSEAVGVARLERLAAANADTVVGPSRYLVEWMAATGWDLPADRCVIPYPTPALLGAVALPDLGTWTPQPLSELVFFGRYEERKGIRVFAEALNRLGPQRLAGLTVTFLGRAVPISAGEVAELLSDGVREAIGEPRFVNDLGSYEARAYLREAGRLAVIPSLVDNSPNVVIECIEDGVSFLAAASGGIPELVAAADHERVLVPAEAARIADRLAAIIAAGQTIRPPAPGYDLDSILPAWEALATPATGATLATGAEPARGEPENTPLVSVVIPHFAQPRFVRYAIQSVVEQDYPNLEIVLVDDGTPDPDLAAEVARLAAEPWTRPLRFIRQENRYLGAARNEGTRQARGDLLVYLDDDDLLAPGYVSTLVTAITASGADAVSCAITTYDDDDGYLEGPPTGTWCFLGDAAEIAPVWNLLGGAAMVVRREAWAAVGGFHERHGVGHEDWDFLLRVVLSGRTVRAVAEPELYRYRVRAGSMVRSTNRYRNMTPIFASIAAELPGHLKGWPNLVAGLHEFAEQRAMDSRAMAWEVSERDKVISALHAQIAALRQEIQQVANRGIEYQQSVESSLAWKVGTQAVRPLRKARNVAGKARKR
jgi:glycosyltransferase involved in cell wall biosynthesis